MPWGGEAAFIGSDGGIFARVGFNQTITIADLAERTMMFMTDVGGPEGTAHGIDAYITGRYNDGQRQDIAHFTVSARDPRGGLSVPQTVAPLRLDEAIGKSWQAILQPRAAVRGNLILAKRALNDDRTFELSTTGSILEHTCVTSPSPPGRGRRRPGGSTPWRRSWRSCAS
jgi:hypothetical protein